MTLSTEVMGLLGVLGAVIGSYWTYVLWRIDKSQTRLWDRMDSVCKQVDELQGEHNILHCIDKKKKGG